MTTTKNKLSIQGIGSASGGEFDKVHVNGKGTIDGDVDCQEFDLNGAGTVHGDIKSEAFRVNGSASIDGKVEVEDGRLDGATKLQHELIFKSFEVNGSITVGGFVQGEKMNVKGRLKAGGNCEVDDFKLEGAFKINGLLSADHVDAVLYGQSNAREIGGQKIVVKRQRKVLSIFQAFFKTNLKVELIEGDDIELENTEADKVCGKNVVIGENCNIGIVEYSGTISKHKNSVVQESKKV
ncbi:polymer-forming cytoskeletal protein [Bacillus horti]|uniref:Cytoskeletal protein CcmA (Bactofilin family) n=1 Tax=Caldalkalibacillus horti TaxID=77523 RepID=A0ABT9W494_9BACI|nr:polymer-forming cytoskeletal protein [Bacillus horti]MDQ0167960.1 cytoskeletal protein CcmA (bactofilin family) [Bacillus horti]